MLEEIEARAASLGEARRVRARARVAAALEEAAPPGVAVEEVEAGALLTGRGLIRRSVTDPALRWIAARAL